MMDDRIKWIEQVAKLVCAENGNPDPELSVRCDSIGEIKPNEGGTKHRDELAAECTIRMSDGRSIPLSLTYGQLTDVSGKELAEKLRRMFKS